MILWFAACSSLPVRVDSTPPVDSDTPVRFIALGDVGRINDTQHEVAAAIAEVCRHQICDFGLLLGDNLYPAGMESDDDPRMTAAFTDVYSDLDLEFKVVLGNHDYGRGDPTRAQRQIAFAARTEGFTLPDRMYSFSTPNADFYALDTDQVFFNGPAEQGAWLDTHLGRSTRRWRVVFGHHPYRSNGKHGNAGSYEGWSMLPWVSGRGLYTLFRQHVHGRADLYVAGHDHNLQVMRHEGLPLVVSGSGSSQRPLVGRDNATDLEAAVPGFAWIELGEQMTVRLYDDKATLLGEQTYPHPRAL